MLFCNVPNFVRIDNVVGCGDDKIQWKNYDFQKMLKCVILCPACTKNLERSLTFIIQVDVNSPIWFSFKRFQLNVISLNSCDVLKEILKQTIKQAGINFYQCCLYYQFYKVEEYFIWVFYFSLSNCVYHINCRPNGLGN